MFGDNYTNEQVRCIMINEGLDYAVLNYMTLENIEDEELRTLCQNMLNSRDKIEEFMINKFGKNWQNFDNEKV